MIVASQSVANSTGGDSDNAASITAAAQTAIDGESYQEALQILVELEHTNPDNADIQNLMGYSHRKLGEYDKALTYYQRALTINPDHLGALEYLGELYLLRDDLPSAEQQAARLTQLCQSKCEELQDLEQAIAAHKAK